MFWKSVWHLLQGRWILLCLFLVTVCGLAKKAWNITFKILNFVELAEPWDGIANQSALSWTQPQDFPQNAMPDKAHLSPLDPSLALTACPPEPKHPSLPRYLTVSDFNPGAYLNHRCFVSLHRPPLHWSSQARLGSPCPPNPEVFLFTLLPHWWWSTMFFRSTFPIEAK